MLRFLVLSCVLVATFVLCQTSCESLHHYVKKYRSQQEGSTSNHMAPDGTLVAASRLCRACEQDVETVKHILFDCSNFKDLRLGDLGDDWPTMDGIMDPPLNYILTFAFEIPRNEVSSLDDKIVNGVSVDIKNFPYQLSLQYYGSHRCGAVIISPKWAITAYHCTANIPTSVLTVRAGSSNSEYGGQVVNIKNKIEIGQKMGTIYDYDMTFLELASNLFFGPGIKNVTLPLLGQPLPAGQKAVVSGWGNLKEGGFSPSLLQAVEVTVFRNDYCAMVYGTYFTNTMMCAGNNDGRGTCQGDSGGPLVVNGQLIGIVSWAFGCARPNYPTVYANVANLRSYIKYFTGI